MTPSPADPSHALGAECLKALRALYPDVEDPNEALPEAVFDLYEHAEVLNALPDALAALETALGRTDVDADSPPDERLADAVRQVTAQAGETASLRKRLGAAERRADDADRRRRQLDTELGQVRKDLQTARSAGSQHRAAARSLEDELAGARRKLEDARRPLADELKAREAELRACQAVRDEAIKVHKTAHMELISTLDALEGALAALAGARRSRWKLNHFLDRLLAALEDREADGRHDRLRERAEAALDERGITLEPPSPAPDFAAPTRDSFVAAARQRQRSERARKGNTGSSPAGQAASRTGSRE